MHYIYSHVTPTFFTKNSQFKIGVHIFSEQANFHAGMEARGCWNGCRGLCSHSLSAYSRDRVHSSASLCCITFVAQPGITETVTGLIL